MMAHMRLILSSVFCLAAVFALTAAPPPQRTPPKNLKVLTPAELQAGAMRNATQGLGVRCDYCHVQGDNSADDKPQKLIARKMFEMTKDINAKLGSDKVHVTCYTCHRGAAAPLTAPPPPDAKQ
jgi:photosynthetic reaction center cytochrome c subunit